MARDGPSLRYRRFSFILEEDLMALRGSMRDSATQYLRPGQPIRAAIGGQAASAIWLGWAGR
jgi:hypothetical protein